MDDSLCPGRWSQATHALPDWWIGKSLSLRHHLVVRGYCDGLSVLDRSRDFTQSRLRIRTLKSTHI